MRLPFQIALIVFITLITPFALPQTKPDSKPAPAAAPAVDPITADYNAAMLARNFTGAVTLAQQLVQLKPTSHNLMLLGNAQLYSKADADALATYEKALVTADSEKPAAGKPLTDWSDGRSQIYVGRGNALLRLKRNDDAIADYNHAAELAINKGKALFNICAVYFNNGNSKDSAAACRRCVAADPANANAWFVLASDLFADAPIEDKKVAIPEEGRVALHKYLELAPDGPHAADTKAMIDMLK